MTAGLAHPTAVPVPRRHPWYPVSPCTAGCLDHRHSPGVGGFRHCLRIARLAVTVGSVAAAGAAVAGLPVWLRRRYLRWSAGALLTALGVAVHVDDHRGPPADTRCRGTRGGLIVANHISYLDVLALATVDPAHFVAKSEVTVLPVVSVVVRWFGVIGVDRGRLRGLPATVATAADRLAADHSVAVFPEGTTRCGRRHHAACGTAFRPAFFQAAIDAGAPILPIRLDFTNSGGITCTAPSFIGDDGFGDTLRRVLRMRDLTITVRVHEPLPPAADRRELAARCHELIVGGHAAVQASAA
ncbi:MAG: lysophospholipid acyltransferase family protein [Gordonia sp. (in: high G+C Gram-positive bacteria)]